MSDYVFQILVYYINTNNILCEKRYYAGKWEDGGLNAKGNKASRGSDFLYAYVDLSGMNDSSLGFYLTGSKTKSRRRYTTTTRGGAQGTLEWTVVMH